MKLSKLAAATLMVGVTLCAYTFSTTQSHAASCGDGDTVTLSGQLSDHFDGTVKSGKLWLEVDTSSPCHVDIIETPAADLPGSCIAGAQFTAAGDVEDGWLVILTASSISCR